jgi:hypothetical protein
MNLIPYVSFIFYVLFITRSSLNLKTSFLQVVIIPLMFGIFCFCCIKFSRYVNTRIERPMPNVQQQTNPRFPILMYRNNTNSNESYVIYQEAPRDYRRSNSLPPSYDEVIKSVTSSNTNPV